MANQFGEKVPDHVAAAEMDGATSVMSTSTLQNMKGKQDTPLKNAAVDRALQKRNIG